MNRMSKRRKYCRFTALGVDEIDYKDLDTLKAYITPRLERLCPVGILAPKPLPASTRDCR